MIYKSYMYSLMDFHKLNILCIQHPDQKGGYSQHPSDLCAELRSRAQASHYGAEGGGEHIFSKAAHPSALGSSEPLHLSAALDSEGPPAGIQSLLRGVSSIASLSKFLSLVVQGTCPTERQTQWLVPCCWHNEL